MTTIRCIQTGLKDTSVLYGFCREVDEICALLGNYVALNVRLLTSSHYPEGPATGHLGTGFSCFHLSKSEC
jgi:hypothetical protein